MRVQIYSLRKPVFSREAESVNVKTASGEITVLDDHRPLIAPLMKGPIRVAGGGREDVIKAESGFIEVRPKGEVNILID